MTAIDTCCSRFAPKSIHPALRFALSMSAKRSPSSWIRRSGSDVGIVLALAVLLAVSSLPAGPGLWTAGRASQTPPRLVSAAGAGYSFPWCGEFVGGAASASELLNISISQCGFLSNVSFSESNATLGPPSSNGSRSIVPTQPVSSYSFSFYLGGVGEVTPGGEIVRFANLSHVSPNLGSTIGNQTGNYVIFNGSGPVDNSSGSWSAGSLLGGDPQESGTAVGEVSVQLTFQFPNGGLKNNSMKFNVDISGWPWASADDSLGLAVGSTALPGQEFTWSPTTRALTEGNASGGGSAVSLGFGSSASTPLGPATVSSSGAVSSGDAMILLSFTGVQGGYGFLHYDPWVAFGAQSPPLAGSSASPFSAMALGLALTVGAAVACGLGVNMVLTRRRLEKRFDMETNS